MESKSFSVIESPYLAIAELCSADGINIPGLPAGNWMWFARINVPHKMRGRGIGTQLMQELCEWADANNISIINCPSAYDPKDQAQLIEFYLHRGFVWLGKECMIRQPKVS